MLRTMLPLAAMATGVVLAACAGGPPTITPPPPTMDVGATETVEAGADPLTLTVLNSELGVGFERVAFSITKADGQPLSTQADVEGVFNRLSDVAPGQQLAQRVASGSALYFGEELPSGGSWIVYNDFDASGPWRFDVNAKLGDWTGRGEVIVEVYGETAAPMAGSRPPLADTPTAAGADAIAAISSDQAPLESLYAESLADATAARKPAVLLFTSPAHCATEACGAALEQFKEAARDVGSQAAFIHVESRDLDDPTQMSDTARAWRLTDEPWLFFVDGRGSVRARVQGEMSAVELKLLLENISR